LTISIWKKLNFYISLSQKVECHLLESSLARINWIRAVDKFCVEQLISCQKCRANDCRAIAIRAVHPHSNKCLKIFASKYVKITFLQDKLECTKELSMNYKFILTFESTFCKDFISDYFYYVRENINYNNK
jgi:hypothetical protein